MLTEEVEEPQKLVNVEDYHRQAKKKLPKMIYDYYSSGKYLLVSCRELPTDPRFV